MNKLVYLGLSILQISKLMYGFWYDYMEPKYGEKDKKQNYVAWIHTAS